MRAKLGIIAVISASLINGISGSNDVESKKAAGPREVITEKIQAGVIQKLKESGATCEHLAVSVAEDRDSATPFKVSYKGLKNVRSPDGVSLKPDGEIVMDYIGGGEWKGNLGTIEIKVPVGKQDSIDLPFTTDSSVIGKWASVDFVKTPADFKPGKQVFKGKLHLDGLTFLEDGKTSRPWWTWTKGRVIHSGDKTVSTYIIREIQGDSYMFFEWMSGDVTISGMKPQYYVLKKVS